MENTWDNATTCEKVEGPCELIRRDEISKALRMTKKGKAAGPTGIVSEMFTAEEDCSVKWLTSHCNLIVAQGRIPDDWKSCILQPIFKGKGDPMECGSYRAIKLLEHAMKVIECVFELKIREKVRIDTIHFGLCQGKELLMQSSQYNRCRRNVAVKERSSTLLLQIWKKHLIEYPERSLDGL